MNVTVNGQPAVLPERSSIVQLLREHDLADKPCAVEINRNIVPKREHDSHELNEGDEIEIVTLVGGG